ncbi:MAG: hypothetical protein QOD82_6395, partial [Pseudonocardiales bacterium]|nr:hypothetical protein [Pseudonocardiales bacterium]
MGGVVESTAAAISRVTLRWSRSTVRGSAVT